MLPMGSSGHLVGFVDGVGSGAWSSGGDLKASSWGKSCPALRFTMLMSSCVGVPGLLVGGSSGDSSGVSREDMAAQQCEASAGDWEAWALSKVARPHADNKQGEDSRCTSLCFVSCNRDGHMGGRHSRSAAKDGPARWGRHWRSAVERTVLQGRGRARSKGL